MIWADPEGGGERGPDSHIENHSLYIWVSIANKQLDPAPCKKLDPSRSGTIEMTVSF